MAHEDMLLYKKFSQKFKNAKEIEEDIENEEDFDNIKSIQEQEEFKIYQKYIRADTNILDYLESHHVSAIQNGQYV